MTYLFPNFTSDDDEYQESLKFWADVWNSLDNPPLNERWSTPWLSVERDGNPIFSAISHNAYLGIRIFQFEPGEAPDTIHHYWDMFDDGMPEIVISAAPSTGNKDRIVALLNSWIYYGTYYHLVLKYD